ncbi:triose-phosphate isomerase [Candidatus Deianiraea vastatrix]|nr:triose-phosphate isomerase [Candidatus Deianiraea vastatrix]
MKKLIIGNWKMNCSREFLCDFGVNFRPNLNKFDVAICAPYTFLQDAKEKMPDGVRVFAQDVAGFTSGAYTGQISAKMLMDIGICGTLIGHSETRKYFQDEEISSKVQCASSEKIDIIYCIGESEKARSDGVYLEFLEAQLKAIKDINCMIAYEPIWAIGTGKVAGIADISEVSSFISSKFGKKVLYGGSVNLENYAQILEIPSIHGLLIGGVSLKVDEMNEILK